MEKQIVENICHVVFIFLTHILTERRYLFFKKKVMKHKRALQFRLHLRYDRISLEHQEMFRALVCHIFSNV